MKIYVGSRDYKPDGFLTLDIDEQFAPDIVGDIRNLDNIDTNSVAEIVASHVLEHLDWPDSFLAISEFSRILKSDGLLKIAVPDLDALTKMLLSGDSAFHVIGLIYGVGGRENKFEQHRYGFTSGMLIEILTLLGFDEFNWWNSDIDDASNGWIPRYDNMAVGMSLNISARKRGDSLVDCLALYKSLCEQPMSDFLMVAADCFIDGKTRLKFSPPKLLQRIHFKLIEANQRIKYLEDIIADLNTD